MAGLTLLYIEDEASQRTAFEKEAAARGFNVISASSGEEGLRKFYPQSADVVLCDLNMPGMDGLEVLGQMKEISPDTPFLVLTSHGSVPQAVRAIKQGADDFILKPLDLDLIENSARKALEARNLKKDLAASQESLRILTENIPDIIYSLNPKGDFISIGGAAKSIMGYKPNQMIGKSVFTLIHPEDREQVASSFEEGIRNKDKSVKTIQFRMITKQGEVKHFEVNRRLIFEGDQAVRSDGVVRDISARKKLEDELKNYSEHLEEMVKERTSRLERAYQQLTALNEVSNRFDQIQDEDQLFDEVPKLLTDSLGFDRAFVLLDADGRLFMRSYRLEKDTPDRAKLFTDLIKREGFEVPLPLSECFQKGETVFLEDLSKEPRWPKELQKLTGAKSLIIAPIKVKEKPIGIIVASIAFQDRVVSEQEVARFEMFANIVGLAVDNVRSYQFLEKMVDERTQSLQESNRELVKSKTQLEAIFDASPNVLMMVDSDDIIVAINRAVESVFNLPIKDIVNKPLKSFLDSVQDCFEKPERFLKQFHKLRMKDIHKDVIELPKLASRQVKPRERLLIPVSMPVLGKDGEKLGKFWSFADITDLGKSTALLRTVVEASPIPSIVSRLDDGKVLFANVPLAELVGLKADEVIGRITPDFYARL
jgi:PAS domain S-box-containing protein